MPTRGATARPSTDPRRHGRLPLALIIVIAGAGAAGRAAAQTPPPLESAAAPSLQEIVVTATRHEQNLSNVPLSVTAITQEGMDLRGIKDFQDVARFTPGVNIDTSGTNNIAIRGISSSGGAGTTGIYLDDTPIQMRALAFNPDEALPKSFDIDRIEVLRGPQGTLFGAGSEGGTVRYITTQPSLSKTSVYSRDEVSYTQGGAPSYEAGIAAGGPLIDGTLGARATVWYRDDGGYIDRINPVTHALEEKNTNYDRTVLVRLAAIWAASERWSVTPSVYYQDRYRNDDESYWPIYSDPSSDRYVSANPTQRDAPDTFWLPALKLEGDFGSFHLISNTSYYHRRDTTGYDGTLYNLGFYQAQPQLSNPLALPVFPESAFLPGVAFPLLDGTGIHLPASVSNYRAPASVQNGQQNFTQEIRLQSSDPNARLIWTTGAFYGSNRQSYLEQIYDPLLNQLSLALTGQPFGAFFTNDLTGAPVPYDPRFPNDSYFLQTNAKDEQLALFGEGTYSLTETLKATVGVRFSKTKFSFNTLTGGPQLFLPPQTNSGNKSEKSFTPKVSLGYQADPSDLYYFTYAKGFRPGGANNPVPQAACGADFANFGISQAPATYSSDSVDSYEVGAKNNFNNRVKIASSIYYIKWNNIQQTVIPPICQISFIANLGQAVAKGADVQAEFAVTGGFTMELSAGYTDSRYTKNSRLTPTESMPIVSSGDAIVGQSSEQSGQPGAPFTASLGLEYKFSAFEHESYVRLDYQYDSRAKWLPAVQDTSTLQFDPANFTVSATNFASVRSGVEFGAWSVAGFIENLTDTHALTAYNYTIDPGTGNSRLLRDFSFRPRTIGFTFTYRN
jgi:iron complex outermembrane recepter protein